MEAFFVIYTFTVIDSFVLQLLNYLFHILFFSPDTWMSVFTVVPVICFGYQVRNFL